MVVVGPAGERRWRQKDLDWNETTERDGGVVVLDGTLATAFVPGVQVGDRVRVQLEYRVRGWQGLPPIELGDPNAPCLESACEMSLSPADEVIWTALGPQSDPGLLLYEVQPDEGRHVWRLPRAMEAMATCDGEHSHVRLVPHLAAIGADVPRSMVYGRTWEEVGEAYLMDIDHLFAGDAEMAAAANSLTAGTTDIVDRIDRIYTWVQQSCHYLGLFSGADGVTPKSARSVYELGSGDCKGLASLLIAMLRNAGVPAYPVLVLTGDAGPFAPDVPNMLQFNHFNRLGGRR